VTPFSKDNWGKIIYSARQLAHVMCMCSCNQPAQSIKMKSQAHLLSAIKIYLQMLPALFGLDAQVHCSFVTIFNLISESRSREVANGAHNL